MIRFPQNLICRACQEPVNISLDELINVFFSGQPYLHDTCGTESTWWRIIKWNLRTYGLVPILIQANVFNTKIVMVPGQFVEIDLTAFGIPADAQMLKLTYTDPTNQFKVLDVADRTVYTQQLFTNKNLELVAFSMQRGQALDVTGEVQVDVDILWVSNDDYSSDLREIIRACNFYFHDNYEDVIIPANTAVEVRVGGVLKELLELHQVEADRAERFLEDTVSYSPQIKILLPVFSRLLNVPVIEGETLRFLVSLIDKRNQIAHSGRLDEPLTREQVIELLVASILSYHYILRVLHPTLIENARKTPQALNHYEMRKVTQSVFLSK